MGALQRIVGLVRKCGDVGDDGKSLYQLKLNLIENCLFGVDIQPIAAQICKLRFFISLICEQEKTDNASENYGFNPLPNRETKFVAANTLVGKKKKSDGGNTLFADPDGRIEETKKELQEKRHEHFSAPTTEAKANTGNKIKNFAKNLQDCLKTIKCLLPRTRVSSPHGIPTTKTP